VQGEAESTEGALHIGKQLDAYQRKGGGGLHDWQRYATRA
jgi:hypothetical protein